MCEVLWPRKFWQIITMIAEHITRLERPQQCRGWHTKERERFVANALLSETGRLDETVIATAESPWIPRRE
jgi:sugar diacid utilization regulator